MFKEKKREHIPELRVGGKSRVNKTFGRSYFLSIKLISESQFYM
jgi:hypothetical protein